MISRPIFKAFAEKVMEDFDSGNSAEFNDPMTKHRRVGMNRSVYDTDSTRPRQQSSLDRPPRAAYSRPPMSRLTTNYDPQTSNDKYSSDWDRLRSWLSRQ